MSSLTRGVAVVAAAAVALAAAPAEAGKRVVARKEVSGVINLNTATPQQLDQLPGVGAQAVKRILEHRAKTPFTRPEDLGRVKGFGPRRLAALRPYLAVSGPTTLVVKKLPPSGAQAGPATVPPTASAPARTPLPVR